jgi:hypothetical protein
VTYVIYKAYALCIGIQRTGIVDQWPTHQFGHLPGTAVSWTSATTATALVHNVLLSSTNSNTKQTRTGLQPAIACKNTGMYVHVNQNVNKRFKITN